MVNRKRKIIYSGSEEAKAFGANFKRIRKELKITQTELADEADVERGTIAKLEGGEFNPTLDLIFVLAKALNMPVKNLFDY
jgi:DNA-binding XRE family transcriptional regulator